MAYEVKQWKNKRGVHENSLRTSELRAEVFHTKICSPELLEEKLNVVGYNISNNNK